MATAARVDLVGNVGYAGCKMVLVSNMSLGFEIIALMGSVHYES